MTWTRGLPSIPVRGATEDATTGFDDPARRRRSMRWSVGFLDFAANPAAAGYDRFANRPIG